MRTNATSKSTPQNLLTAGLSKETQKTADADEITGVVWDVLAQDALKGIELFSYPLLCVYFWFTTIACASFASIS